MHTGHCTQVEKLFDVEDYHVFQDMQHMIFRISLTMHIFCLMMRLNSYDRML